MRVESGHTPPWKTWPVEPVGGTDSVSMFTPPPQPTRARLYTHARLTFRLCLGAGEGPRRGPFDGASAAGAVWGWRTRPLDRSLGLRRGGRAIYAASGRLFEGGQSGSPRMDSSTRVLTVGDSQTRRGGPSASMEEQEGSIEPRGPIKPHEPDPQRARAMSAKALGREQAAPGLVKIRGGGPSFAEPRGPAESLDLLDPEGGAKSAEPRGQGGGSR